MSLRLRLTLVYSGMLSGFVGLLSILIYAFVSLLFVDFVDGDLQKSANLIVSQLRADGIGNLQIGPGFILLSDDLYYQVWSRDYQLVGYSENASQFTQALDQEKLPTGETYFHDVEIDGVFYRTISVPLEVEGQPSGWLQVGLELTEIRHTLTLIKIAILFSALFAIGVSVVLGWIVIGQALLPLVTMAEIASRITSTNDLSQRIPVQTEANDEINTLALNFNQTFVRLERLFNSQRRFLADVSHDLRTPLTVIKGNVGLMRLMKRFDEDSLNTIEKEVDRLSRLVGDLLFMAQAEAGKLPLTIVNVKIDEILLEVFEEMTVVSGGKRNLHLKDFNQISIQGDRDRLKQVFLNLGANAVNYTPEGGLIEFSLAQEGDWVRCVVRDEGQGIPKKELAHLFERFNRGEESRTRHNDRTGFGLGLPIAYWIVRNHGGRIDVESQEGLGTTFTVWLPKTQDQKSLPPSLE
ncbi:MAG: sensor histidine kinase [Chloroflexi bacterium]|nr:sensor histidine kinase [Chloroflexota bacterium]